MRRLIGLGLALLLALAGAATAQAACRYQPGPDGLLIRAVVLTGAADPRRGEVLIDATGQIVCVDRRCRPRGARPARIDCPDAVLSPGFVDVHEHLAFSHIAPTPDDGERYGHRHDWRKGLRGHAAKESFTASFDPDDLAWGELRHLLSGTTSIVGGNMAPGLTRNLDIHAGLEGLATPRATYAVFPLDDASGVLRNGDCDYGPQAARTEQVAALHAYIAHVGEGVDAEARNEFACVSDPTFDTVPAATGGGTAQDLVHENVAIIHGVALTPDQLGRVAARGATLVWSPRSNLSLYGATLDIATAERLGIVVALGTDWLPSGSFSMPREAACAEAFAQAGGVALPARTLWSMMTANGARAAGMPTLIGAIRPGLTADLILVARPDADADPYAAVVNAKPQAIMLILRGGKALVGDPALMASAGLSDPACETADLAGAPKTLCVAGEMGQSYAALARTMAERGRWPVAFAEAPPIEPTCAVRSKVG
jgi:cytosine/adenosine deaminase-related metal-dependent hydrolase